MSADLWTRIWLLSQAYPGLAITFALVLWCLLGALVAVCIFAMSRPLGSVEQRREDEAQADAIRSWQRSGGNWMGDL